MTAQPTESGVHQMWAPNPVRQRLANYTIEDVFLLPDDAPRVELRDGVMIVVLSPTIGHQDIVYLLRRWLEDHAPKGSYRVSNAVGVAVDVNSTLEPDVVLLRAPVELSRHYVQAEQVVIAVEVVSPGTRRRDRLEKPADYAAAGVPYYWRIEQDPVHVFAYQLEAGRGYRPIADSAEELVLDEPFPIRMPIQAITA
jgi:Uma2 family endonuclease